MAVLICRRAYSLLDGEPPPSRYAVRVRFYESLQLASSSEVDCEAV